MFTNVFVQASQKQQTARSLLNARFFDPKRYDFANVGRYKVKQKIRLENTSIELDLSRNLVDPETGEIIVEKGHCFDSPSHGKTLAHFIDNGTIVNVLSIRRWRSWPNQWPSKSSKSFHQKIQNKKSTWSVMAIQILPHVPFVQQTHCFNELLLTTWWKASQCRWHRPLRKPSDSFCWWIIAKPIPYRACSDGTCRAWTDVVQVTNLDTTTLINIRPVVASISKEFFGASQLSQFMDKQTHWVSWPINVVYLP